MLPSGSYVRVHEQSAFAPPKRYAEPRNAGNKFAFDTWKKILVAYIGTFHVPTLFVFVLAPSISDTGVSRFLSLVILEGTSFPSVISGSVLTLPLYQLQII